MLGLYTERDPAASGGVWDRADAFQRFEAALNSGDAARIGAALPVAWSAMQEAELEVPFAVLFGKALTDLTLDGEAAQIARHVALLSPQRDAAAARMRPGDDRDAFLVALARGELTGVVAPDSLGRAIAAAYRAPVLAAESQALLDGNRTGEAILSAIDSIGRGVQGDLKGVTEGLSLLRAAGLDEVARRTALELMILERRG